MEKISTNIFIQEEIIKKNNELRASLYEDLKDGIISKEDFETLKVGMNERIANAKKAIAELKNLAGSEAHSTVILSQIDADIFRKLGINLTCEPQYQSKKLYHK